jgi:hypothetical protein
VRGLGLEMRNDFIIFTFLYFDQIYQVVECMYMIKITFFCFVLLIASKLIFLILFKFFQCLIVDSI